MREYPIDRLSRPLDRFIKGQSSAGIALFLCAAIAVVLANSPWREHYQAALQHVVALRIDNFVVELDLLHIINDGLMAMFFFVVTLELKHQFRVGELSDIRQAALPIAASFGGMAFPALIYLIINQFQVPEAHGWGITLGTDTAFVLVILGLLGKRVPPAIKAFFIAVSVIDDIVSVSVIALFYTSDLYVWNLTLGAVFLLALAIMNLMGVRNMTAFAVVGIAGVWMAFLLSGVHATVAGVLAAVAIPAKTRIGGESYVRMVRDMADEFDGTLEPGRKSLTEEQVYLVHKLKKFSLYVESPSLRLERTLEPWVNFLVLPLFALANAGIELPNNFEAFSHPITMGVSMGLLLGKPLGLLLMTWLFVRLGWGALGRNVEWSHMIAISVISGLGFTMALFISELAFAEAWMRADAKLGILIASVTAGIIGTILFLRIKPEEPPAAPETSG